MIGAAGLTVLALLGCMLAPNLVVFTASIFHSDDRAADERPDEKPDPVHPAEG